MARYGDYDGLAKETERAMYRNGRYPVCTCDKCKRKLYYGAEVLEWDGEVFCDDCTRDLVRSLTREIDDRDIEIVLED